MLQSIAPSLSRLRMKLQEYFYVTTRDGRKRSGETWSEINFEPLKSENRQPYNSERSVYIYIYIRRGERIERMIIRNKLPPPLLHVTQNLLFPELPIHSSQRFRTIKRSVLPENRREIRSKMGLSPARISISTKCPCCGKWPNRNGPFVTRPDRLRPPPFWSASRHPFFSPPLESKGADRFLSRCGVKTSWVDLGRATEQWRTIRAGHRAPLFFVATTGSNRRSSDLRLGFLFFPFLFFLILVAVDRDRETRIHNLRCLIFFFFGLEILIL